MSGTAAALMGILASTLNAGLPPQPSQRSKGDTAAGDWVQADVYDLKVKAVTRCRDPGRAVTYLGVELRIRSRTKSLFVAPRDASLRDGGVLLPAVRDRLVAGCRPTLQPTHLRRAAETGGFVIFETPALTGGLTLEYAPTRWGGAQRITVPLPELAEERDTTAQRSRKQRSRDR